MVSSKAPFDIDPKVVSRLDDSHVLTSILTGILEMHVLSDTVAFQIRGLLVFIIDKNFRD
jgi:hypothetical protein